MSAKLELVGAERILDGADLARLDRWADRRGVGPWWRRLTFGLGPGVTLAELLERAGERRQLRVLLPFLASHGLVREAEGAGPSSSEAGR